MVFSQNRGAGSAARAEANRPSQGQEFPEAPR